jgi:hypothetical protein
VHGSEAYSGRRKVQKEQEEAGTGRKSLGQMGAHIEHTW